MIKKGWGNKKLGKFLEIGAPLDSTLDVAKENGWMPLGLDLIKRESVHPFLVANFEEYETSEKYDVIWAAHIFEHFKDPIGVVEKCASLLIDGGILFVIMPDPWFVDWGDNPYQWIHWNIKEHHILWDRDSFCDVMETFGFEITKKHRNTTYEYLCSGDFHIIGQKTDDTNRHRELQQT
jgi:predicted SAM-dependent methyltransferase